MIDVQNNDAQAINGADRFGLNQRRRACGRRRWRWGPKTMSHNNKSRWFYDYLCIYVLPRPTCCHIYYIVYPILLVSILPVVVASSSMPKLMLLMVVTLVSCLVLCYIIHLLNPRTVINPNMTSKHILWLLVNGCFQSKYYYGRAFAFPSDLSSICVCTQYSPGSIWRQEEKGSPR